MPPLYFVPHAVASSYSYSFYGGTTVLNHPFRPPAGGALGYSSSPPPHTACRSSAAVSPQNSVTEASSSMSATAKKPSHSACSCGPTA